MNEILNLLFNLTTTGKNARCILISWVLCFLTYSGWSQDPVFSRYTTNPQIDNPAASGASRNSELYAIYRNQFPALAVNYLTYNIGFSTFFDDLRSGFGLNLLYDDAADGLYTTTMATLSYAYKLQLGEGAYLNAGLSLGLGRTEVAFNKLLFPDQIDPVTGPVSGGGIPFPTDELLPRDNAVTFLDMGAGILLYMNRFFASASFHHLNNPANDFLTAEFNESNGVDGLPLRMSFRGEANLPLLEGRRETIISLHPTVLYTRQRDFGQLNAGAYVRYKDLDVGATLRLSGSTTDAIIPSVGFAFDALRAYYAYDFTISDLAGRSGGAHEIGLRYRIGPERKAEVDCFDLYR